MPTDLSRFLNRKPPDSKMPTGSLQISGIFFFFVILRNNFYHMLSLHSELAGVSVVFMPAIWWVRGNGPVQPPYKLLA